MRRDASTLCRAFGPTYPIDARILREVQPSAQSADPTRSALILQTLQANKQYEARDNATT